MEYEEQPLINKNDQLQSYYYSLESRIGYRLLLGGTRHFGYYPSRTSWPLSIHKSLREMEARLYEGMDLPSGSKVLDAGCGVGHVAIYMAQRGLKVHAIDVVPHHITKAKRFVHAAGLDNAVAVRWMDYHHLECYADNSFDGVYTSETFVHATEPERVLKEFIRILRPGGRLTMHEYDHVDLDEIKTNRTAAEAMRKINKWGAMPTNELFLPGVMQSMIKDAGFKDLEDKDFSRNIEPMLLLFFLLAYVPYIFVCFLGLERHFINTVAGVEAYRGREGWRYIHVSATKPGGKLRVHAPDVHGSD